MVGWHHQLKGHEFEQTPGDSERQGSLACHIPWGCRVRHDLATEQRTTAMTKFPPVSSHVRDQHSWPGQARAVTAKTAHSGPQSSNCLPKGSSKFVSIALIFISFTRPFKSRF